MENHDLIKKTTENFLDLIEKYNKKPFLWIGTKEMGKQGHIQYDSEGNPETASWTGINKKLSLIKRPANNIYGECIPCAFGLVYDFNKNNFYLSGYKGSKEKRFETIDKAIGELENIFNQCLEENMIVLDENAEYDRKNGINEMDSTDKLRYFFKSGYEDNININIKEKDSLPYLILYRYGDV